MDYNELEELLDELVGEGKNIQSAQEWGTSGESYRRDVIRIKDRIKAEFNRLALVEADAMTAVHKMRDAEYRRKAD